MKIVRLLPIAIAGMLAILSGCAAVRTHDGDSRNDSPERAVNAGTENVSSEIVTPVIDEAATLQDLCAYAALKNPELEAAFNRWKAALEKIPQARALPDPRFTYAWYIRNVETRVGPQRHRFDLAQSFPWFGILELRGDMASEEARIRKQEYDRQKTRLFYDVRSVWYEYSYLQSAHRITGKNLQLVSYFENVARSKYETGQATMADVIKAQVELGKIEERLLSLHEMRETLTVRLNAMLDRPVDAPLPTPSGTPVSAIGYSDDEIIALVKENNPGLRMIDVQVVKQGKAIDLAKKRFFPDLVLGVSIVETGSSSMPDLADSGKDPVMAMMSINFPFWRESYRAGVREAEFLKMAIARERDNSENILVSDIKTVLYKYRDSGRKASMFRDSLIPKARQALNVTQAAFESGAKDFLSLIDTQRTLLELELAYERALADRAGYRARIEMLAGMELEKKGR